MENIKFQGFEDWLEERFIGTNEFRGVPITEDNYEGMFENWLESLDRQEVIDYAESYGKYIYIHGQRRALYELKNKDVKTENLTTK